MFVYNGGGRERGVWREEEERENTVESNLNCVFLHLAVLEKAGSGREPSGPVEALPFTLPLCPAAAFSR